MEPERWQKVEELYHAALECEASKRAEFLEQACSGDEALRREVESLLPMRNPRRRSWKFGIFDPAKVVEPGRNWQPSPGAGTNLARVTSEMSEMTEMTAR